MDVTKEDDGFVSLADIDWTCGNETADTIYLQWNEGWGIWEQVIDEACNRSGVVKWQRADEIERLRAEAELKDAALANATRIAAEAVAEAGLKEAKIAVLESKLEEALSYDYRNLS